MHEEMEKKYPLNKKGVSPELPRLIRTIKKSGRGKKYDCVIGTSGGTDSTYMLYLAKQYGLRPLAVHFDNGWNSEIAVRNIQRSTEKLNIDLETVVANWEEFRNLQISFLKASVSDAEIPTDVAIHAVLHEIAAKEKIKYVFFGHAFRVEGIVPVTWTYMEGRYLNSIHHQFGNGRITSFPNITIKSLFYYKIIKRIKVVPFLNYFSYNKEKVKKILSKELNWTYYDGHHHESLYTKFFQSYYLPKKFNIDKRKLEYSALVRSGQISRPKALLQIKKPYPYDPDLIPYVLEKLELSNSQFKKILATPPKCFLDYPTYYPFLSALKPLLYLGYKLKLVPDIIYLKYFAW